MHSGCAPQVFTSIHPEYTIVEATLHTTCTKRTTCTQCILHIIEAKWIHITIGCSSAQIIKAESGAGNMQDIRNRIPKTINESFSFCKIGDAVIYTISPKFERKKTSLKSLEIVWAGMVSSIILLLIPVLVEQFRDIWKIWRLFVVWNF